jgi:hypothetical protein
VNSSQPTVHERRVQVSVGDQLARSSKCRKVGKSGIKQLEDERGCRKGQKQARSWKVCNQAQAVSITDLAGHHATIFTISSADHLRTSNGATDTKTRG